MTFDDAIESAKEQPAAYVVSPLSKTYLYKGSARNLKERLKDHRAGRVSRTKNLRPLVLLYYEYVSTYTEARRKENFLKSGRGRDWLENQVNKVGQTVPPKADPPVAGNLLANAFGGSA